MEERLLKIDKIPKLDRFSNFFKPVLLEVAKQVTRQIRQSKSPKSQDECLDMIQKAYFEFMSLEPKQLINATGVVVHTNLGRSPLSKDLIDKISPLISSYSNLEYNIDGGKRGDRYAFSAKLLALLCGCEDALIVNNNAAAVFLVLNTFAKNKEVVVSRGELVEIGGSFRIPEVMASSGSILKEVGTTNKTHLKDYANAINSSSSMLLKVHKSNYDIVGFASGVELASLVSLARQNEILSYYDLGGGYVNELPFGLSLDEPNIKKIVESGVDLVSFSGDKLFGSVQCGVILGKSKLINELKQNQLLRMLRVDKITINFLNETIKSYLNKDYKDIKSLDQIYKPLKNLEENAKFVQKSIPCQSQIQSSKTFIGGGTMPNKSYPTIVLSFAGNANQNEKKFRQKGIIGRIEDQKFILDFRSILDTDIPNLIQKIKEIEL